MLKWNKEISQKKALKKEIVLRGSSLQKKTSAKEKLVLNLKDNPP